jgi:RNA polymerase sigma-70 factor (ECF subfamily)
VNSKHTWESATDRTIVERLRARDESAVAEVAARYGQRIFQLAFRYTRNREDAEEIAQDVLLKVYRRIGAFRGDAALSSWIYRITFNTAMSRLRSSRAIRIAGRQGRRTSRESTRAGDGGAVSRRQLAAWSSLADEELLRAQLRRAVARALRALPEIYRVPVVLRDIRGLSTEEASAMLRVNNQTLKSRLHRGRKVLRGHLTAFSSGLSLHRPVAIPTARGTGLLSAA